MADDIRDRWIDAFTTLEAHGFTDGAQPLEGAFIAVFRAVEQHLAGLNFELHSTRSAAALEVKRVRIDAITDVQRVRDAAEREIQRVRALYTGVGSEQAQLEVKRHQCQGDDVYSDDESLLFMPQSPHACETQAKSDEATADEEAELDARVESLFVDEESDVVSSVDAAKVRRYEE
ncbi:hypothetical protein LTR95_006473 [Oleoguttula sp. CCFEE 5521]